MIIQNILIEAIKKRVYIDFQYENNQVRKVAPYAIYISSARNEVLDAYQCEGYSKTGGLPDWRRFVLRDISYVQLSDEIFSVHENYRSNSERYSNYIFKI